MNKGQITFDGGQDDPPALTDLRILITASEAYPALEEAFLSAKSEISASFLVFDLRTRLRSAAGREIGETWFDLIVACLRRGVRLRIVLSDFDPIARAKMHRGTWHSLRMFCAAAEVAGPGADMRVTAAMHPARTGAVLRLLISPLIMARVWRTAGWLNGLDLPERDAALRDMPGVARLMTTTTTGRVRPKLWPLPTLTPGTHHQKIAVIDRSLLYVGGLDLNERRYDDTRHDRPADQTWHDVQLLARGAVAQTAAAHLDGFLDVAAGRTEATARRSPFLTTLSRKRAFDAFSFGPEPVVSDLFDTHLAAVSRSTDLIYLESQYFRDRKLARALAHAARRNPRLGVILILPGAPEELAFEGRDGLDTQMGEWYQAQCLRRLQRAFGSRLFIGGAAQKRKLRGGRETLAEAPLIYIHAKVSVFDLREAIVSSANLNGRSFRWDTESGLHLTDPDHVALLRRRCMEHWLPRGADGSFYDAQSAVAAWRGLALANAARSPEDRDGFIVPYDLRAAETFGTAVPFLPEEMV